MSGKYWFITSYMLLLIFSAYINKIPEKLKKNDFEKFLLIMFLIFSLIPTIIQFHVMNDGGKGVANMLLMYLIGRYIRLYWNKKIQTKKLILVGAGLILFGFALNMALSMLRGGKGVYAPFARDCSSIIILSSIIIFLVFKNLCFSSNVINLLAKHVVAVYLCEGAVRTFLSQLFDITIFSEKWYLFIVLAVYVLIVMLGCMILDTIRGFILNPIENKVCSVVVKVYDLSVNICNKYCQKCKE